MHRWQTAATGLLLVLASVSCGLAQEGTAHRVSLGTALDADPDGTLRYREDTGWDSANFTNSHWGVEYGTTLSTSPWIVVVQQPTRTNASLIASANQLTLDLAGGTYSITPFLLNKVVQGGKVVVADKLNSGSFLRIANGTLSNDVSSFSGVTVGDANAVGRLLVQNGTVKAQYVRVGTIVDSRGLVTLEEGGNVQVSNELQLANGSVTLSGANSTLTVNRAEIGEIGGAGVITLEDPTALFHVTKAFGSGDLAIDNARPTAFGGNPGLIVNAGTVLIDDQLLLGASFSNRYGAVVINGGRVAVGGSVVYNVDVSDTGGGKIFLNDGRLEVASPTAFLPNTNNNFYWKNGTLAFNAANTSLADTQIKRYTRQGAISYGGGRAEGAIASGQTLEASGTLALSGSTIRLAGGTIKVGGNLTVSAPLDGYGTLDAVVTGSGSITNTTSNELVIGSLNGANLIDSSGDVVVGQKGIDGTFAGTSTGSGAFIKTGPAAQTVTGSLLNTGGVRVASGSLAVSGATGRLQTSEVSVADGATLRVQSGATAAAAAASVGSSPAATVLARLDLHDAALAVGGNLTNNGIVELTNSDLQIDGAFVNHGQLINNGSLTATVTGDGRLTGSGMFHGPVTVASGAILAPGNSPGTATFADLTLAGGGAFELQLADAKGTAGVEWDLAVVAGTLSIAATSADPVTIVLKSLDATGAAGLLADFDPDGVWSWKFLSAAIADPAAIDSGLFRIDDSDFLAWNSAPGGIFSTAALSDGLYVSYAPAPAAVPEPGSLLLLSLAGLTAGGVTAYRKRRRSAA